MLSRRCGHAALNAAFLSIRNRQCSSAAASCIVANHCLQSRPLPIQAPKISLSRSSRYRRYTTDLHKRATKALGTKPKQNLNDGGFELPAVTDDWRVKDEKVDVNALQQEAAAIATVAKVPFLQKEDAEDRESDQRGDPNASSSSRFRQLHEFAPRIVVVGVGGAGGNAVNNMIAQGLTGVDFVALNTDAQHLSNTLTDNRLQLGPDINFGLGCGANPDAGRLAAEQSRDAIAHFVQDAHMVFITAGMGGGTGTGAAPVVAELCYDRGILTVGVVTKPFRFEGTHRMRLANEGIQRLKHCVDTLIVIPNQNLFQLVDANTPLVKAFQMADDVLLAGVKSITDLMTTPGLINLDFADVQSVMHGMGNAILGTGQASFTDDGVDGQDRALRAAEKALANPLLGSKMDIGSAKGMLVNITGGNDMTLVEVDKAAEYITSRLLDDSANVIVGSAFNESLDGCIRVSVVATGIDDIDDTVGPK